MKEPERQLPAMVAPHRPIPRLVRPIPLKVQRPMPPAPAPPPMKVARPIPKRATELFYEEAYQQGIPAHEVHAAVVESHDWHRKWTQQDEEGHTLPHPRPVHAVMPEHYAVMDRHLGARNPSPVENEAFLDRKRSLIEEEEEYYRRQCHQHQTVPDYQCPDQPEAPVPHVVLDLNDRQPSIFGESDDGSGDGLPTTKRRINKDIFSDPAVSPEESSRLLLPWPTPVNIIAPGLVRPVARRVHQVLPIPPGPCDANRIPTLVSARALHHSPSPLSYPCSSSSGFGQGSDVVEDEDAREEQTPGIVHSGSLQCLPPVATARDDLLRALAVNGGDVNSEMFKTSLTKLLEITERNKQNCPDPKEPDLDGKWLTLSKAAFFGSLGDNDAGDPMYTLGRMAFDMFSPTSLVCSLQGNFNLIEVVGEDERKELVDRIPTSLREEVESGKTVLRTYHLVVAFTVEPNAAEYPDAPNKDVRRPIRGIMTTFGYTLPDPDVENRFSIWFTGGKIEPNRTPADIREWNRLFELHPPKRPFGERVKLLAAKLLMGVEAPTKLAEDSSMEYVFTRPIGGHGIAYMDVVYMDGTLRIARGHRGTVFVFSRLPEK